VTLSGLSHDECAQLAARRGAALSPNALAALVNLTGGNPLAVVEILRRDRRPAQSSEVMPARAHEPLGGTLHHSLERTWDGSGGSCPPRPGEPSSSPSPTTARRAGILPLR
jgi:hypothetical protein